MFSYFRTNWRIQIPNLILIIYMLATLLLNFLGSTFGEWITDFQNILFMGISAMLVMQLLADKRIVDLEEKVYGNQRLPADFYIFDGPEPEHVELLRKAKKIDLLGVNLKKSLEINHTILAQAVANGAAIRVIITDPKGEGFKAALFRSNGENEKLLNENFEYSLERLRDLNSITKRKQSIRIRKLKYPPSFAMMIVDEKKCFIKIYGHDGVLDGKYPWLELEPIRDKWWYRYFEDQYNILWNEGMD